MVERLLIVTALALLVGVAELPAADPAPPLDKPLTPADRAFWAFRPPVRPPVPTVHQVDWVRNPVDAFILARLEAAGIRPSPPADRVALLRRVFDDLIGLPPTPEEQAAFLADDLPDAYERLVDRLLASRHYGERWAQHWLDVVRYGESNGYEADAERPHAWKYRDYVIRSLNDDKPYTKFLTEQLAGDELAAGRPAAEAADLWVATGMHRCGPVHMVGGNTDPEELRQEQLIEMVTGVGAAVLGLTVQCARCHDHKFDPISQADYYRLQAFFAPAKYAEIDLATETEREAVKKRTAELQAKTAPLQKKVADLEAPYRARLREEKLAKLEAKYRDALAVPADKRTPEQKKLAGETGVLLKITWDEVVGALTPDDRAKRAAWRAEIHALEQERPAPAAQAWAIKAEGQPPTHLLKRGDLKKKGPVVPPAFPRVLAVATGADSPPSDKPPTRTDLANWLTRPDHPLTARVMVNRLWQHHFGRGLVATPNDFGHNGTAPTHPELLDWLAVEFVEHGWSLKHLHRLMVTSATYRQASRGRQPPEAHPENPPETHPETDPDNKLLWRMNRRRLDAESIRDAQLTVAGNLNRAVGGPMVRVPLEPEVYELIFSEDEPDHLWSVTPDPAQHTRRSIYLFAKRNVRLPLLEAFDRPDLLTPCAARPVSTFAPQALILMNGPFAREQSQVFAARLARETDGDVNRVVERAYRLAFARPPRDAERQLAREFLAEQTERLRARLPVSVPAQWPERLDPALGAALADYCLALFNSNEFVYVP
jgi:hypothetical protein